MSITRDPNDFNKLTEFTDEINQIDRQYSIFEDSLFNMRPTTQTAIVFDVNKTETTLLPSAQRSGRASTYGQDNDTDTRSLPLSFHKHSDFITQEDILGVRRTGTPEGIQTLDLARAEKLEKMRRQVDQTKEYSKMQTAFKGQFVDAQGNIYADMFNEFGITQTEIDLVLGTGTTDLQTKLRQIKRAVRAGLTNGGFFRGMDVYMNPDMYDRFISHDSMKEAYKYFAATQNLLRDDITDQFSTGGINFYSLDGSFKLPTGSSVDLVADNTAHVVPRVEGLFRGYYGPSDKLVTGGISPTYAFSYDDGRNESEEVTVQWADLLFTTQPSALIKLTSSN